MAKSFCVWMIPTAMMIGLYVAIDPMLMLRWHEDMMPEGFLPNKANVTIKNYDHYNPEMHYDSFIIGSSIGINHWVEDWKKYLPDNAVAYHFDMSMMTLEQIDKSLDYLLEHGDVRNVLLVCDIFLFGRGETNHFPFYTPSEMYDSPIEKLSYQAKMFRIWYSYEFLYNWIMGKAFSALTHGHGHTLWSREKDYLDARTNEARAVAKEESIDAEYARELISNGKIDTSIEVINPFFVEPAIGQENYGYLKSIEKKLEENNINYIVVTPAIRRLRSLNPADEGILMDIFGEKFIYLNFEMSEIASNKYLWFDNIHYRPKIGRKIMERIYNDSVLEYE